MSSPRDNQDREGVHPILLEDEIPGGVAYVGLSKGRISEFTTEHFGRLPIPGDNIRRIM
ncbi:MAG: hypothetical protein ACFFCZ_09985 [Promethearchaeota archaeon]